MSGVGGWGQPATAAPKAKRFRGGKRVGLTRNQMRKQEYAKLAGVSTRKASGDEKPKSKLKHVDHPRGPCGNVGCMRCHPENHGICGNWKCKFQCVQKAQA